MAARGDGPLILTRRRSDSPRRSAPGLLVDDGETIIREIKDFRVLALRDKSGLSSHLAVLQVILEAQRLIPPQFHNWSTK